MNIRIPLAVLHLQYKVNFSFLSLEKSVQFDESCFFTDSGQITFSFQYVVFFCHFYQFYDVKVTVIKFRYVVVKFQKGPDIKVVGW